MHPFSRSCSTALTLWIIVTNVRLSTTQAARSDSQTSISVRQGLQSLECQHQHQLQVVWMSLLTCQLFIPCAMAKRRPCVSPKRPKPNDVAEVSRFVKVALLGPGKVLLFLGCLETWGLVPFPLLAEGMEGNDRGEGPSGHLSHGRLLDVTKIEHDFRYPPFQEFDFSIVWTRQISIAALWQIGMLAMGRVLRTFHRRIFPQRQWKMKHDKTW